jgi:acetyl-CoA carboxylase carboxyltransferase component
VADKPSPIPNPASGIPRGVSIGESWPAMVTELQNDKKTGHLDSAGRRLVEGLFARGEFTEIGRLIGVMSTPQAAGVEAEPRNGIGAAYRVAGEVVAAWGKASGQILFAVADEAPDDTPRNPAGAAVAWNVVAEALRCGAPLVSFPAARRARDDLRPAASFLRTGLQVDLAQEEASLATIPKIVALVGSVDLPVAFEMAMAHYVIAGPGAEILLPDGTTVTATELADLGWTDDACDTAAEVLRTVRAVVSLMPGAAAPAIEISADRPHGHGAVAELESVICDAGSACAFSAQAPGSLIAGIGRISGRPAGVAYGAVTSHADHVRLAKLLRVCDTFTMPLVILADGVPPAGLDVPAGLLAALDSVLVLAGQVPDMSSDPDLYDVVLTWSHRADVRADSVIDAEQTREVVGRVLAELATGTKPEQRPPQQRSAASRWRHR